MRVSQFGVGALTALAMSAAPTTRVTASPLFELVGAVQGPAGLNARALPAQAASAYFNPAFLPDADAGFDLGVFVLGDQIGIGLFGRPGRSADVPEATADMQRPGGGSYEHVGIPTRWLENGRPATPPDPPLAPRPRQAAGSSQRTRTYQVIGFVQKLLRGRVGVGLYAMVPHQEFTSARAFYNDEREQYFSNSLHPELYADRLTTTSLSFGVGARVSQVLSLGVVASLGLRTAARTPTYVSDIGRFGAIKVDSDVGVTAALAPHFGAVLRPGPRTRIAATVHTPQKIEIDTDFSFLVASGLEQRAQVGFVHGYLPWTFGLGFHQMLAGDEDGGVAAVASATLGLWSQYRDRHGERPHPAYGWSNTVAGAAGLRGHLGGTVLHADVGFAPSPVPEQTGRSNYVDNPRGTALFGIERRTSFDWGDLRFGVGAQVHRLFVRTHHKFPPVPAGGDAQVRDEVPDDAVVGTMPLAGREGLQTNNPGWPGFTSGGWIVGGGAHLGIGF